MNVRRGLFRAWVLLSIIWVISSSVVGYVMIYDELGHARFQYVHQMRENVEPWKVDWSKPYSELMISPTEANAAPPQFNPVEFEYLKDWDKHVDEGTMRRDRFADGSYLYIDKVLNEKDQDFLSTAFWQQRWGRWLSLIWPWVIGAVLPCIVILLLGRAMIWVAGGFRTEP